MSTATYKCLRCKIDFTARTADRARGWARYCSKSCKAKTQEAKTGQHREFQERRSEYGFDRDQNAAGHIFASGYFGHGQE